jgi:hypothetical protein
MVCTRSVGLVIAACKEAARLVTTSMYDIVRPYSGRCGVHALLPSCVPEGRCVEYGREGRSSGHLERGMHQNRKGACVSLIWPEWLGPQSAPAPKIPSRGGTYLPAAEHPVALATDAARWVRLLLALRPRMSKYRRTDDAAREGNPAPTTHSHIPSGRSPRLYLF